ncbi:hypothetical protein Droror1_Dr00017667 [Drosera rotundifolia]
MGSFLQIAGGVGSLWCSNCVQNKAARGGEVIVGGFDQGRIRPRCYWNRLAVDRERSDPGELWWRTRHHLTRSHHHLTRHHQLGTSPPPLHAPLAEVSAVLRPRKPRAKLPSSCHLRPAIAPPLETSPASSPSFGSLPSAGSGSDNASSQPGSGLCENLGWEMEQWA